MEEEKKQKLSASVSINSKLEKLGITSYQDMAFHVPYRYDDETKIIGLADLSVGDVAQIEGTVIAVKILYRPIRLLHVYLEDDSIGLSLKFFNFYPSQSKSLFKGAKVRAIGEVKASRSGLEMIHPRYKVVNKETPLPKSLTPIYPSVAGLKQSTLRRLARVSLSKISSLDTLPKKIRDDLNLMGYMESLLILHTPSTNVNQDLLVARQHPAWCRLKFDELLAQQLSLRLQRKEKNKYKAHALTAPNLMSEKLKAFLPFQLTMEQSRALQEIIGDLKQRNPMQRLLQGDVGSGKTVVAAFAALQVISNGYQVAVMAPTEILAEQHFKKFSAWFAPLNLKTVLLSGNQKGKDRETICWDIKNGDCNLVVGTHALFQEKVEFNNLALTIIDEQHRFGVGQRLALRNKGQNKKSTTYPHQLMMTATPIPRTLAMSYYADLDVSIIKGLPPNRKPIVMKLIERSRKTKLIDYLYRVCASGRQAYWVCPLIEERELTIGGISPQSAEKTFEELKASLPNLSIGLLHGRLAGDQKSAVMEQFLKKEINLLVATTVIEVGVDVPSATVMVIENSERMGLSQLHQLRGRIGRGKMESTCILLYQEPLSAIAKERLKVIYENTDGFVVADHDLRVRGPGEFVGVKQSGLPMLKFADIHEDQDLLHEAVKLAKILVDKNSEIVPPHVNRWLGKKLSYLTA